MVLVERSSEQTDTEHRGLAGINGLGGEMGDGSLEVMSPAFLAVLIEHDQLPGAVAEDDLIPAVSIEIGGKTMFDSRGFVTCLHYFQTMKHEGNVVGGWGNNDMQRVDLTSDGGGDGGEPVLRITVTFVGVIRAGRYGTVDATAIGKFGFNGNAVRERTEGAASSMGSGKSSEIV